MAKQGLRNGAEEFLAHLFYQLQLIRLIVERAVGTMLRRGARHRVMATACWSFPIYSQTFVYQELTQLIRRGFKVRFIYSKLDREQPMPSQFSRLWRARRRLILHPSVCEGSYAYFLKRMPEKIDALVDMLSRASGMTPQEVRSHYHFLQAFSFSRMVEAYRPDYLHSYFFYEGTLFALVASHLLDIPRGVSCYADHILEDYALKVVPLHLRQCNLLIATSERIKRELLSIAPQAEPDRIVVKPNAINAAQFPVEVRKDPENGQPYRLVSVSRIEPKKGLVYLVEAVRHLRDRGVNVELHLIGGVDDSASSKDYYRALDSRIKELDLSNVVHLEGRKTESEIKGFFKDSHLFVAPFVETESGDKDGIPTSLLEGMSSGLPIVATDAGSITEVIEDGQSGVLVAQRDPAALGTVIETLLRDPDQRRRLGREAADSIRRRLDVRVCEGIFHEQVRTVIDGYHPNEEASYAGRAQSDVTSSGRELSHDPARSVSQTQVTVIVTTYNHERFINEAIDGVLMQETNFDYEVVIIEDCSTDHTRDIVIEYQKAHPGKIRLVLSETNKCDNSEFMKAILSSSSPYVAILDGDDYWTSPQKLQKQVNYLDLHPECAICFHNVRILYDDGSQEPRDSNGLDQKEVSTMEDLIDGCFIETCSTMFRRSSLCEFPSWYTNDKSADWSLFILAAQHGKIGYINEVMGVYRQHSGGFWTGLSRAEQLERIIEFYEVLRNQLPEQHRGRIDTERVRNCHDLALEHGRIGDEAAARRYLGESKWLLRVAGSNEAHLVFTPDRLDRVRIAIENAESGTSHDIQLNQPYLKVEANKRYAVRFQARADRPRRLSVGFAEAHEPWNGLGLYKRIELTSVWRSFEEEFVAAADEHNARIHFDLGDSDVPVELTSVSLRSLPDEQVIEPKLPTMPVGKSQREKTRSGRALDDRNALILTYHRVAAMDSDPWSLCVTPQHFGEHLDILRRHAHPIALWQLKEALRDGNISRRSVVVTFDDGYADNLYNAKPLLEGRDISATVFIATGYLEQEREFWWDKLERVLLKPGTLPETLRLSINGNPHQWDLNGASHYSEDAARKNRDWKALEDAPTSRHSLYYSLWQLLQPLPESERRNVLDEIIAWASIGQGNQPDRPTLTPEEVVALAQGKLVEVGSHTVTHPVLSALSADLQQKEVQQSKAILEEILGRPVTSFAYPYGARCNYTDETVSTVREAGFACACSTLEGVVERDTDRFQLPRVHVQDWDGEEFARQLSLWFDGSREE